MLLAICMVCSSAAMAQDDINIEARLGYTIGGTMPLEMPASIRGLNAYTPQPNFQLGVDAEKMIAPDWGLQVGLNLDHKGMSTDAITKGYHMTMVRGGEAIEGFFTGNVVTDNDTWGLTLPVVVTWHPAQNVKLHAGPYVQCYLSKAFGGYAYDGYLRKDTPTGERIELGSSDTERGEYSFNDEMRPIDLGLDLGVDWYVGKRLGVYANLNWGLLNAFRSSFTTIEQSMNPVYGTVGVTYRLRK